MKLYHFTAEAYLERIKREGITRGDVATSPTGGFNAPWLTNDPSWESQRWQRGSILDKSEVRITVNIPDDDSKCVYWSTLAGALKVSSQWYLALDDAGGGKSENWWVYRGTVPPEWFEAIHLRREVGFLEIARGCGAGKRNPDTLDAIMKDFTSRLKIHMDSIYDRTPIKFSPGILYITKAAFQAMPGAPMVPDAEARNLAIAFIKHALRSPPPHITITDRMITIHQMPNNRVLRIETRFKDHKDPFSEENETTAYEVDEPVVK